MRVYFTEEAVAERVAMDVGNPGVYLVYEDVASSDTAAASWTEAGGSVLSPAGANYAYVELLVWMASGWVTFNNCTLQMGLGQTLVSD